MRRVWIWLGGSVILLIALVTALSFFIDEPLRRYVERQFNVHLNGYTLRIGAMDVHPLTLSVDLKDIAILQDANPDPPIARVRVLNGSLQWRELLSARVVADLLIERPIVHVNLTQARTEAEDEVPVEQRGWQEALQAVMPLKINQLRAVDGDFTYVDEGPFRPLHISQVNFRAGNIQNIRSAEHVYPSEVHLEGMVFEAGRVLVDGHADFLAVPHLGILAHVTLEQVELDYFKPRGYLPT